jgi:LPXTG-motif cell wall-anchored protein
MRRVNILAAVVVIALAGALMFWLLQPATGSETSSFVSLGLLVISGAAFVAALLVDRKRLSGVDTEPMQLWTTVGALVVLAVFAALSGFPIAAAAVGLAALTAIVASLRAGNHAPEERSTS